MFEAPNFTFWNVVYTALGAAVLWATWGDDDLRVVGISKFVRLFGVVGRKRRLLEMVISVAIGTLVGIGVSSPKTTAQAITAGLGWTGIVIRPDREQQKRQGRQ